MSNKPRIYGYCPAGCKWETVHQDDFLRSAAFVACQKVNGVFSLEPLKTYRIKKTSALYSAGYGFSISVLYSADGLWAEDSVYDPTKVITDVFGNLFTPNVAYKEFATVRLCAMYSGGNVRVAVVEFDGKVVHVVLPSTAANETEVFENVELRVTGAEECYLVNEHAEILLTADGFETVKPSSVDMTEFDNGKIVERFADGTQRTTTITFDNDGNPVKITDGDGNVTTLTW